jgi:small subunit ribosomal protein S2
VAEANKLGIPIVAIVDTNADPDIITVPIAGNDDAIRSVSLIAGALADTISEARAARPAREEAEEQDFATYSTDGGSVEGGDSDAEKRRRRPRRKRRPKPEAIVARMKDPEGGEAKSDAPVAVDAPAAADAGS